MLDKIIQNMNQESWVFIGIITIFALIFHIRFTHTAAQKAPPILVTCGILGTFFGVALGLLDFNPNDVQKSVPALIEGIKTAFWVSAWGIFCALTIKIRDSSYSLFLKKRITSQKTTGATINDLASLLTAVQQALVGGEDSTLLSQIKLARQDSNDRLDKLSKSMDNFCEKVAESNSKALIEALKEVIKDFNTKINEQFGDNFKQLNQAVEKILIWQEQYKQQITYMISQQEITSKNMSIASERYKDLVDKAEIYTKTANDMSSILDSLVSQKNQLNKSMELLSTLIANSEKGLPEIEKHVIEMTNQVSKGVKIANEEMQALLHNVIKNSNQEFNANIKQIVEKTKEQIVILDKALSEELSKSLESFGRQMASLSKKFAEDYSPITDKLRMVLDIAR